MQVDVNETNNFAINLGDENMCHGCEKINSSLIYAFPIYTISLLSIVGNTLVIAVIWRTVALHNNQGLYMVSLALSDLGSAIIFATFSGRFALMGHGPTSGLELDIGAGLAYMCLTASLFNIIAIALDKLAQIEFPYRYERSWTARKCAFLIASYWILLAALSFLPTRYVPIDRYYYKFNSDTFTFVTVHDTPVSALIVVRMSLFAILVIILSLGYGRLYCIARRHRSRECRKSDSGLSSTTSGTSRPLVTRGTLTIGLVLMAFLLAWLPFFTVQIVLAKSNNLRAFWPKNVSFSLIWFAMLHTCSNFIIYGGTYRPFRRGLKHFLHIRRSVRHDGNFTTNNVELLKHTA